MKKLVLTLLPTAALIAWAYAATAQPPDRQGGPPDDQQQGGRGGPQGNRRGSPPGWKLGTVIPPPVQRQLNLSDDQKRQLHDLEKEVKERVLKILNDDQKRKLQTMQRRGPGGPPPGGEGDDRGGPGGDGNRGGPPRDRQDRDPPDGGGGGTVELSTTAGIQWFASLDSGLKEAQRSGRPILLVSAAPHCAGVPGIW